MKNLIFKSATIGTLISCPFNKGKKNFLFVLLIVFGVCACHHQKGILQQEQTIQFSFDATKAQDNKSGRLSSNDVPHAVVVKVLGDNGATILDRVQLELYKFGENYLSLPVTLTVGEYSLVEFFVVNEDNNVIYVAPQEDSEKAHLVEDPLEITFSVTKDQITTVTPEVLAVTAEDDPSEYGYGQFGFKAVETIEMVVSVFVQGENNFELTEAEISVTGIGSDWDYTTSLEASANQLEIRKFESYLVEVTKESYNTWQNTVSLDDIKQMEILLEAEVSADYQLEWSKTYIDGRASDVLSTTDGYIVSGRLPYPGIGYVLKINKEGEVVWQWEHDRAAAYGLALMDNGDIIMVGFKYFTDGAHGNDAMVVRISPSGQTIWTKYYYGSQTAPDYAYSVDVTSDNHIVIGGSKSVASDPENYWLLKLDGQGNELLSQRYGNPSIHGRARCIKVIQDGGYILGGDWKYRDPYQIMKISEDGSMIWKKGLGRVMIYDVEEFVDGTLIATGEKFVGGYWIDYAIKFTADGEIVWENTFGETLMRWTKYSFNAVQVLPDGSFIAGGSKANEYNTPSNWVIKNIGSDGQQINEFVFDGYALYSMVYDNNSNILAVGSAYTNIGIKSFQVSKIKVE